MYMCELENHLKWVVKDRKVLKLMKTFLKLQKLMSNWKE